MFHARVFADVYRNAIVLCGYLRMYFGIVSHFRQTTHLSGWFVEIDPVRAALVCQAPNGTDYGHQQFAYYATVPGWSRRAKQVSRRR